MKTLKLFFVILSLFVLSGLFLVKNVYAAPSNEDIGLNFEETTSIRNFEKQTKKSIEDANLLIRKKELEKAKKQLDNALVSVNGKVSVYENNAQILVSEGKENSAKIYYREASSLEKFAVGISKSLQELALLEKEYKAEKLREESAQHTTEGFEYLRTGNLDKAQANFKKAINIYSDNRRAKDGLVAVEKARIRSNTQHVSELLRSACNNIQANDFDKAEKELQEVLELEPGNRRAQSYLKDIEKGRQAKEYKNLLASVDRKIEEGKNNLSLGRFEEAEAGLKEALMLLSPDEKRRSREIDTLLASMPQSKQKHQAQIKYERIENIVVSARQQFEENKLAELIKQGRDYILENNFEEAKKKFSEALKIRPQNELAMKYLTQTEQAKRDYEKNKDIDKVIAEGRKYLEAEQLDKADVSFKKALKMSPSKDKQLQIQSLLSDIDKTKQAIKDKGLQKQADEFINKGIENLNKEQYVQAKVNFEKALSIKPDYSQAKEWLIRLETIQEEKTHQKLQEIMTEGKEYLNDNQFDKAKAKFEEILKINPAHKEAIYYLNGLDKAKEEYENYQQFEKIKVKIDNGIEFLKEEQFDKAESAFKEAVDISPVDMRQQTIVAIEDGVNSFIQEVETKGQVDKYISSGITYLDNKEFEKAEEAFNCALSLVPGHKGAKQCLQKLQIARLKHQNTQLLEQIGSSMGLESRESRRDKLEKDINQLIGQIRIKIGEKE